MHSKYDYDASLYAAFIHSLKTVMPVALKISRALYVYQTAEQPAALRTLHDSAFEKIKNIDQKLHLAIVVVLP